MLNDFEFLPVVVGNWLVIDLINQLKNPNRLVPHNLWEFLILLLCQVRAKSFFQRRFLDWRLWELVLDRIREVAEHRPYHEILYIFYLSLVVHI